ncbi:MAG: hypothetical protein FWE20_12175 [Defluviitaleaceae bacterium]|nr:hypothetical protein [Defluviitaleaceae bacterium]
MFEPSGITAAVCPTLRREEVQEHTGDPSAIHGNPRTAPFTAIGGTVETVTMLRNVGCAIRSPDGENLA